jgi:hypothetical protein
MRALRRIAWIGWSLTAGCEAWFDEVGPPGQLFPLMRFEDASGALAYVPRGPSYGMGWGDPNGDGLPDLWSGNHATPPTLHLNQGDGTFLETYATGWLDTSMGAWAEQTYDAHGTLFADLDGDGLEDLIESVGAQRGEGLGGTVVHRNVAGQQFLEAPDALGLAHPGASGRCPIPADVNRDGLTDVVMVAQPSTSGERPTALFVQGADGAFVQTAESAPDVAIPTALCGQLADIDGDLQAEIVTWGRPGHLLAQAGDAEDLHDVSADVGLPTPPLMPYDVAIGDFDNDRDNDLFVTRWQERSAVTAREADGFIGMALRVQGNAQGASFAAEGKVSVGLDPGTFWTTDVVRLGGDCSVRRLPIEAIRLTLDPTEPDVQGVCPFQPGVDTGLFLGFADGRWHATLSSQAWNRGNVSVQAEGAVSDVVFEDVDLPTVEEEQTSNRDRLYMRSADGVFVDEGWNRGIQQYTTCTSVVTGDFDNDMDLDLFLVCATPVENTADLLYLNAGDGSFVLAQDHGAEGPSFGRGDSVAMADYDGDGFLDLAVSNGYAAAPFNDGPLSLWRNEGNRNHWLEIDLVGTVSAREAWGAVVFVTAGGVTQRREVTGGTHATAQDHRRLHFGLGAWTDIDLVEIHWPTGAVDQLTGVAVDEVLTAVEGG